MKKARAVSPVGAILGIKPCGYVRKQDILAYSPVCAMYLDEPTPENGHRAVPMFTHDQVLFILKKRQADKEQS